jgi:hypothetical protein
MDSVNAKFNSTLMKHVTQQESSISKRQTKGGDYVIDPNGDLNITVIEYEKKKFRKYEEYEEDEDTDDADQQPPQPVNSATFKVKREIVTSNFPVLRAMGSFGHGNHVAPKVTPQVTVATDLYFQQSLLKVGAYVKSPLFVPHSFPTFLPKWEITNISCCRIAILNQHHH